MSCSVFVIGDPHFKTQNIKEVDVFVSRVIDKIKEVCPDIIVLLGDLLHDHERIHISPLNRVYDFIDKLRKITKTYIIVGNHDMISNQVFLEDKHWMNGLKEWKNVKIVDKVVCDNIGGCNVMFVPYVYPGRFLEAIKTEVDEKDIGEYDCIFAHQEFKGCKMGAITSVDGDEWDLSFPNVISGHIHSNQRIQKNIYYPGSALQHAFGESNKNVVCNVILSRGGVENMEDSRYMNGCYLEEYDLKLSRKRIVYCDLDSLEEGELVNNLSMDKSGDEIKISVSGSYEKFKNFRKSREYKKMVKEGKKIVFKAKKLDLIKEENLHLDLAGLDDKEGRCNGSEFNILLNKLVDMEKDEYLNTCYKSILQK